VHQGRPCDTYIVGKSGAVNAASMTAMQVDDVIRSERLDLPLLSLDQLDHLAAGEGASVGADLHAILPIPWLDEVRWLAGVRAQQLRLRPDDAPWLLRAILLRPAEGALQAIGYLNFHSAPDERGMVEVGYTLLPEARGNGYAIEAVRAAVDWATGVHGVRRFRASVAPDNERSLNLIAKLGFRQTGEQWDAEDGLELVFELER
jgi:ribosomal-protein-alanine N-acetyltransferase